MNRIVLTSLLAIAVPLAAIGGGGILLEKHTRAPDAPKPPMRRGIYSAGGVTSYWRNLQSTGVAAERHFLEVDLVFPVVYGAALLASLLWLWASLGRPFSPALLVGLVGVAVFADWTENLVLLHEISPFIANLESTADPTWITVASAATLAKLAGGGASLLAVVAMAIARICRARDGSVMGSVG